MDETGKPENWLDKMHQICHELDRDGYYCHNKARSFANIGMDGMAADLADLGDDLHKRAKELRLAIHDKITEDLHETEMRGVTIVKAALAGAGVKIT